jgi:hypothetical protein
MSGTWQSGPSFQFQNPVSAWQQYHGTNGISGLAPAPGHPPDYATGAMSPPPPVFCTAAELTLDSWSPSKSAGARSAEQPSPRSGVTIADFASGADGAAQPKQQQRLTPGAAMEPSQAWQLEQRNAELASQCRELQVMLSVQLLIRRANHLLCSAGVCCRPQACQGRACELDVCAAGQAASRRLRLGSLPQQPGVASTQHRQQPPAPGRRPRG